MPLSVRSFMFATPSTNRLTKRPFPLINQISVLDICQSLSTYQSLYTSSDLHGQLKHFHMSYVPATSSAPHRLQSSLCAFQCASWHASPQYRACLHPVHFMMPAPLQPGLEQCVLASRYAVCSTEAPTCLKTVAALLPGISGIRNCVSARILPLRAT
jgi:hypothetical protein